VNKRKDSNNYRKEISNTKKRTQIEQRHRGRNVHDFIG
jgi:hypothetical protein